MSETDFRTLPDLASRALAGSVMYASDEFFAAKENLITPTASVFDPAEFCAKGKVYDGWETRRRFGRDLSTLADTPDGDVAIVRLGLPGVVRGAVIDTSWFTGNYPPHASLEAVHLPGHPSTDDLLAATWRPLLSRVELAGDTENAFAVADDEPVTHVRLTMHPDGGIARLRVHGEPRPDRRFLTGTIDLAALENGADVIECTNRFYSSPINVISPGRAVHMGEGWENARRRDDANDHLTVRLAGAGRVRSVEIDTSWFVGNAPGAASLTGLTPDGAEVAIVARTRLVPDCRHRFLAESDAVIDAVRLDVFPDGGVSRLRVWGELEEV